jgi:hypothetical protein
VVADDWTGDELRKHRDVDRDLEQAAVRRGAAMNVDEVRERVKGEERNAERQFEAGQREGLTDDSVEGANGELGVFENGEDCEVRRDSDSRGKTPPTALCAADQQGRCVVEDDLAGEQQNKDRLTPRVERQRYRDENDVLRRDAGNRAIDDKE